LEGVWLQQLTQGEMTVPVMVMVKSISQSEAGEMPRTNCLKRSATSLKNSSKQACCSHEGLHPSARGKRVHLSGGQRTVADGPFTETKKVIAGFGLWQVKSMEEAVEWGMRCPNPMEGHCETEIRPVFEAADCSVELTSELRLRRSVCALRPKGVANRPR
jgi:hypothetical protein